MPRDLLPGRIIQSLDLALASYSPAAKSLHWAKFFTPRMAAALRNEQELARFRSPGSPLFTDLEDSSNWFRTADGFVSFANAVGVHWFDRFSEVSVGRPRTHRIAARAVNHHELVLCQHLAAIATALPREPRLIVEIGGGFGGLAHKLKRLYPSASIVLLDLPEALALQAWYLSRLRPDAKFHLLSDGVRLVPGEQDFTLLPGWLANELPLAGADLFINTRSFMEMTPDVIAGYFNMIQQSDRAFFYCVNRYCKSTVGQPIRFRDYPFDDRWEPILSRPSPLQLHVHELLARRTSKPHEGFRDLLVRMPEDVPVSVRGRIGFRKKLSLAPLFLTDPTGSTPPPSQTRRNCSAWR